MGKKIKKEKQKLSPKTQLNFYTNSHIGLVCYFFFCGLYKNKIASKRIYHKDNNKTTKQANKNASCPEEALIYGGC